MFYYVLLLCIPLVSCFQSISQKQYNLRTRYPNALMFSAITSLIALVFFIITSGFRFSYDPRLVIYALGFAVCYSTAWVGTVLALRYGLMAISTLIVSCSLVIPTIYGLTIGEKMTPILGIGILLLLTAMVLANLKFTQKEKFSVKWLICVFLAFAGNGACALFQNQSKRTLGEDFNHEFMIIALSASFIILMTCAKITGSNFKQEFKSAVPFATVNGIANAVINFLMLLTIGNIQNLILYPTTAALNMIFTFLLAFIFYKERFSLYQYVGYAIGIVSIILLNI